jgi:uncharacterized delta-60 repeat protein
MTKLILTFFFIFLFALPLFAQTADTVWIRRYDATGGDDDGWAIAVDSLNNVYVTGQSYGSGINHDYATIKYKPNGDTAWVRRYNGEWNYWDKPNAIAVDGSGNVYVTGFSWESSAGSSLTTIKYKSNGDTAWLRIYSLGAANAIALDDSGNIYVAGYYSYNGTTSFDYATIKYKPDGDTAWTRRYNSPANDSDFATAITVDGSGNVYVTGESYSSGTNHDYATIKYKPNGDTAWVRRYNGEWNYWDKPNAIAVDGSGNVCVTGWSWESPPGSSLTTIKYKPNGDTAWLRIYPQGAANAISLDDSDNIYVAGYGYSATTSFDYATIKYKPNGDTAWVRRYNGPANDSDFATKIAVDGSGNVYVTGKSYGSGTNYDYATIKYKPNGDTAWVRRYNGPGNGNDVPNAVVLNCSGNIFVTGWSVGSGTGDDYATIKYVDFLRGDANGDAKRTVADVVFLINYLFKGGPPPNPKEAGDVNCDCHLTVSDIVYLINYLFKGGPPPAC